MNDINKDILLHIEKIISNLDFIDDANWITGFLTDLESILNVADKFYDITRVAINKDKSKLLTNTIQNNTPITIKFGKFSINIILLTGSIRFLDVNVNINLNHNLVYKELKAHIHQFINVIKAKPLTDHQFTYVTNHVLLLQLLYKMCLIPLSKTTCYTLTAALKSFFKAKYSFSITTPNMIFYIKQFYNLNHLWTEQLAEIATTLLNQFNVSFKLLYNLSRIRLFHLQQLELTSFSPLNHWSLLFNFK